MSAEEAELLKERAHAFLRNAKRLFDEGEYDLAAFNVEQFCHLILKYKLLIRTGGLFKNAFDHKASKGAR